MTPVKSRINKIIVKCIYAALLAGFTTYNTHAQEEAPADTSGQAIRKALSESYSTRNEIFIAGLKEKTSDKRLLKHYEAKYKSIFKAMNDEIIEGQMMQMPEISPELDKILLQIKTHNSDVPGDIQILLLREHLPNAYTAGDKTILVTLGLLQCLQNEDQIAGVLAHEIGHMLLDHSLKAVKYHYEHDKQNSASAREIRQIEVKRTDRAFELLKSSIYKSHEIGRMNELEADSIGYILYSNAQYNKADYLKLYENLDNYDSSVTGNIDSAVYRRFFNLPGQPFNDSWMKGEDFSSYNYNSFTRKLNEDSVSTHPRAAERISYLKHSFKDLEPIVPANSAADDTYNKLATVAANEQIPNLYFNERYGEVVYSCLVNLLEHPQDATSKKWLGKGLQKLYEARRDYKLNKFLDRVDPKDQTKSYIRFLNFAWNLKLDELKKIADYYAVEE